MHLYMKLSIFVGIFCIFFATSATAEWIAKPLKCQANEHFECGSACQTECAKLGQTCPYHTKTCNRACFCDKGYARNEDGRCVLIRECQNMPLIPCPGQNEHYSCGSACQVTCDNYGQVCPIVNIKCNEWCYCDEGYARDNNSICIPIWQCPQFNGPTECIKPNEHYQHGQVCEKRCATLNKPCNYLSTIDGCYCNDGYARDENGDCILIEECTKEPCLVIDPPPPCPGSEGSDESYEPKGSYECKCT